MSVNIKEKEKNRGHGRKIELAHILSTASLGFRRNRNAPSITITISEKNAQGFTKGIKAEALRSLLSLTLVIPLSRPLDCIFSSFSSTVFMRLRISSRCPELIPEL